MYEAHRWPVWEYYSDSLLNFANPGKGSLNYYSQPLPIRHLMVSFHEKEIVREYILFFFSIVSNLASRIFVIEKEIAQIVRLQQL